jgi:hypothetical protein
MTATTCNLCGSTEKDLAEHVRRAHPDAASERIYEADGSVIVSDASLEPVAEYDPDHQTWQRD